MVLNCKAFKKLLFGESFVCSNDMFENLQANAIFIEISSVRKGVF